jgi:hypothetical protein
MFEFIKKIFGTKPTVNPSPDVPYKVEAPKVEVESLTAKPKKAPAKPKSVAKPAPKKSKKQ